MTARSARVQLSTGVTLNVVETGAKDSPPVIFLHGFPESHRTWRGLVPLLSDRYRMIMPDQRGYAGSDRPQGLEAYKTAILVDDIFALADALGLESFALVGHDWGGSIAWLAAARDDPKLERLAILNAPHWAVFQKSLIEDEEQRQSSQYITWFRHPLAEKGIEAMGLEIFFDKVIGHADLTNVTEADKQQYLAEWSQPGALTAMLNWYRASPLVVPPPGATVPLPDILLKLSKRICIPTLVIWGMRDTALLPVQLDGLDRLVDDLRIERISDAGHFAPWEAPEAVAAALGGFLGEGSKARALAQ